MTWANPVGAKASAAPKITMVRFKGKQARFFIGIPLHFRIVRLRSVVEEQDFRNIPQKNYTPSIRGTISPQSNQIKSLRKPGNANLPIGGLPDANHEIGVPGVQPIALVRMARSEPSRLADVSAA